MMGSYESKRGGGYVLVLFTLSGLMEVLISNRNIPNSRSSLFSHEKIEITEIDYTSEG